MTPTAAAQWLRRSMANSTDRTLDEDTDEEDLDLPAETQREHTWTMVADIPCPTCDPAARPFNIRPSSLTATRLQAERGFTELRRLPAASRDVAVGTPLARLYSATPTAGWLTPQPGWWPIPRVTGMVEASSNRIVTRCDECHQCNAILLAVDHIQARQ